MLIINLFSLSFTSIEIEGERVSSSYVPWGAGGWSKTNKGEQGSGRESKLGTLERKYFLNVPLWVELKANGVIFFTTLLHFHYSISLETANTQKGEVFLLRIL